jgi:DNA segregation ATPase FtsK/SpoIIIE-like protein
MIVDKHYYDEESETVETIFGGRKTVKKIKYFPKIYYKVKNGKMEIQIELLMNQYQDQFIKLEKTFESGLYSEVIDKEQLDGYIKYTLIFDMLSSRIPIAEMKVKNGELKIMDGLYWAFDKLPHMLICGGTGSGKTWFLMMIIHALVATDSVLYILDPKNADLADFEGKLPNVYHKKADIIMIIENFYMEMMERSRVMKQMSSYKTGENYAYLGLPANFLMFDEYVAFMEMCDMKETQAVLNHLKQIVMLGRQAGFFIILGCQRPDAKYMGDGIRDQFNMRVALGRNSSLGYTMMFGEANKEFFQKSIKGRGYVDQGTGVITEMYTPTVPKGFDFFTEIINVYESNHGRHIEIPDDDEDEDDEIDLDEVI